MFDLKEGRGPGRRSRQAAAVITAAVVCLAAAGCSAVKSMANGAASAQAPHPTTGTATSGTDLKLSSVPAGSAFASAVSSVVPPDPLGPPADPFNGTPADHWADGAAGIVLPAAEPIGPYSKAQVAYAYQATRNLLIAANLDKQTMLGGAPTAFADLLTSPQRTTFLDGLSKRGLDKQGYPLSTRTWVLSFPPGDAQLIGSVIKVHGSMYAKAVRDSNGTDELDVHLDYLFVYPIEPPHQPDNWMRIVAEDQWEVQFANWQGAATTFAPWVDNGGSVAGAECGTTDGYQHPAYPVQVATQPTASPTGTAADPYVMGQPNSAACEATTGT
jgi:hypothetical protein